MRFGRSKGLGRCLAAFLFLSAGCSCGDDDGEDQDAGPDGDADGDTDSDADSDGDTDTDAGTGQEEQIGAEINEAVTDLAESGSGQGFIGLIDGLVDSLDTVEDNTVDFAPCPRVDILGEDAWKLSYGSVDCKCDLNDPDAWLASAAPCPTRSGVLAGGPVLLDRGRVRDDFDWKVTFGGEETTTCWCIDEKGQISTEEDVAVELPHRRGRALGAPRFAGSFFLDRGGQGEWTARDSTVGVAVQNQEYPIELTPNLTIGFDVATATVTGGAAFGDTYTFTIDPVDPLAFDRNDDCACPEAGTLTISNVTAGRDIIVDYQVDERTRCGADVVMLRTDGGPCDRDDPADSCDVNLAAEQTPAWIPSDLGSIDGLCLQGKYACPHSTDEVECSDIAGTYHVGQGDVLFTLEDDAGPLQDTVTGNTIAGLQAGRPERLCHEAILGQLSSLTRHAWRFDVHANCQVDIAEGLPDREVNELRWMPRTACAKLDRPSGTLVNADLGGNVGDAMFGEDSDVTVTVGDGAFTIDAVFPVDGRLADRCLADIDDANACLHDWTIPVACIANLENLLDPAVTADDLPAGYCADAKQEIDECGDETLRDLARKIAEWDDGTDEGDDGCITVDDDGRLGIRDIARCDGVREQLISLMADVRSGDDADRPFVSMLELLGVIRADGLRQRIVLQARQGDCGDQCLPDPGDDEAFSGDAGDMPGRDSQLEIELEAGQRIHYVSIGQATLDVPDMADLEETCRRVDSVCRDAALLDRFAGVLDFTSTCEAMDHICDLLGACDADGLLDDWLANLDPDDWGLDGVTGLNLDEIRQALDEWGLSLGAYQDRTVSFAHVFVVDVGEDLEGTEATLDEDIELVPEANLVEDTLAEVVKRHLYWSLPIYFEGDLSEGAVLLGANSITPEDGHFEYDGDRATYDVRIAAPNRPDVVLSVPVVQPVEVCHPTGWMLDNFYSPAIRWNGAYDIVATLPEATFPSIVDLATFKTALADAADTESPDFVTLHLGSYMPGEEGFPGNPSYNPLNQHMALWRVVPDMGLFTMVQPTWAQVAPTGRDYMHSPQDLLDYVLNVGVTRAERRLFTASDLYGDSDDLEWGNDIAIVKTVTIDFKINFVFNTDLIADENSYFFRRDVLETMLDMCDQNLGCVVE